MATPAPAAPIRKKRNFKALQLDVTKSTPPAPEPAPIRLAPAPGASTGGKKRPPPMKLAAPKLPSNAAAADSDSTVLTVGGSNSAPATGIGSASKTSYKYHDTLSTTIANLDLNSEKKYHDLRTEDLKDLQELGQGNGGSVKKVEHTPTSTIMAKKVRLSFTVAAFRGHWSHACSQTVLDRSHRCQALSEKTNSAGTTNYARLQLAVHHILLRRVHLGSQHMHMHGVHGQRLLGWHLQEDWGD